MIKDAGVRPLAEVLYRLSEHVKNADTGVFYLYGEGVVGWIHLNEGKYEDVVMQNHYSDEAVALLLNVSMAACRFQPWKVFPGKHAPLSETAKGLLAAGAQAPATVSGALRPAASTSVAPLPRQATPTAAPTRTPPQDKTLQMQTVEKLAMAYLGPMASIICQEAWEDHGGGFPAVLAIAENLSGDAREAFLADVRKTTEY